MPHKFNANRRGKIPKQKYRVPNWASYNESLRRRGDLTVWVSEEVLGLWRAPRRVTRGGQRTYSNLAIEICLTLSAVFKQPLRQTQGFMRSIATLLGVEIAVPDFSTLSRLVSSTVIARAAGTVLSEYRAATAQPHQAVVDRSGATDRSKSPVFFSATGQTRHQPCTARIASAWLTPLARLTTKLVI